ncbi:MAG: MATE family efflux transporter [Christensenellales bacterium]
MQQDLTQGSIRAGLIRFSLPLIAGNLLQQLYNVADTLIVGRFLGNVALAAVGSAFSLMILLTSLILGLCMGSGVVFSQLYGEGNTEKLKTAMTNAFCLIAALSLLLMALYAAERVHLRSAAAGSRAGYHQLPAGDLRGHFLHVPL